MTRFAIRYDRWCGWLLDLLGLTGIGRRVGRVDVSADDVTTTMGRALRRRFPRAVDRAVS